MKRILLVIVLVTVVAAALLGSRRLPALIAESLSGCGQASLELEGIIYLGSVCAQTPTPAPGDTPPPEPTGAPQPTPKPTGTPQPTLEPTSTPEPTTEPTSTPEPTPGHDTTACHGAETGDGHTHGFCVEDLPPGAIRDFLEANPLFAGVGQPWLSGPTENGYPHTDGKHEGYKHLFQEFDTCYQFRVPSGQDYLCLKAVWLQVHSMGTAHEVRAPGGRHSLTFVAEVCDAAFAECGIVAGGEIEHYGEVHAQYKQFDCRDLEDGVEYPEPYHTDRPPYIANHGDRDFTSRPARIFWSSLRGGEIVPYVGEVNNLIQVAWSENAFELTSPEPALCAHPAFDRIWAESTDEGFINQYVIWTVSIMIDDYPRPYTGFTNRDGFPAPECAEPSFSCIPLFISGAVPAGELRFNLPVANDTFDTPAGVIDITEPGVYMPGMAP